jgi:hypothetical protein
MGEALYGPFHFLTVINGGTPCTIPRLKGTYDEALSTFAFNFSLRRYTVVGCRVFGGRFHACNDTAVLFEVGRCRLTL